MSNLKETMGTETEVQEVKTYLKKIIILLLIAASALFFIAGWRLNTSGDRLTRLRSRDGNTVAEAYFQEVGRYGHAFSYFSCALGLICLSIPLGFIYATKDQRQHEEKPFN